MHDDNSKKSSKKQKRSDLALQEGSRHELWIHGLGSSGEGVGDLQGYTVFVFGALPGEQVEVLLTECHTRYAHGKLLSIQKKSPHRVKPPCPLFERCGGCQLMHLSYQEQLVSKRQRVIDALERIGKIPGSCVHPCTPSPQPLHYRNKIQLPIQSIEGRSVGGFYARASHNFIEVPACLIHCKQGEEIYHQIQKILQASSIQPFDPKTESGELKHIILKSGQKTQQTLVVLVTNQKKTQALLSLAEQIKKSSPLVHGVVHNIQSKTSNVILGDRYEVLCGEGSIEERLLDFHFRISAAAFFQVNPLQAENLYQKVLDLADPKKDELLFDAYCGVGTLSCVLAPHVRQVVGVEWVSEAIHDANHNAARNGLSNLHFTAAPAETFIRTLAFADTILLNPPRKGCDPSLLSEIPRLKPKKIIYVSCDPATLARDLAILQTLSFQVESVMPFDMFPQTAHVESVAFLRSCSCCDIISRDG